MAHIKESKENIEKEFPEVYKSLVDKMVKKNIDPKDLEFGYDYCVMIDNSPEPTNLQETISDFERRYGISISAKHGRKTTSECVKRSGDGNKLPSVFQTMATNHWNSISKVKTTDKNRVSNLDSVMKSVGKTGTSATQPSQPFRVGNGLDFMKHLMNSQMLQKPVYPELEDIKNTKPDIYQSYLDKADGSCLVMYNPRHQKCDEWGFLIEPVLLSTKRGDDVRFVTENWGSHYIIYKDRASWAGSLSKIDKAFEAKEGEEFTGWKRTKQYRLTRDEIKQLIGNKIFKDGGISF